MEDLKELVKDPKEWILEYVDTSRCICVGPCLVQFVNPVPTATNATLILNIRDGQDINGRIKCSIKHQYPCCAIPNPAYFRRGLFIELHTNAAAACIQYLPLAD